MKLLTIYCLFYPQTDTHSYKDLHSDWEQCASPGVLKFQVETFA